MLAQHAFALESALLVGANGALVVAIDEQRHAPAVEGVEREAQRETDRLGTQGRESAKWAALGRVRRGKHIAPTRSMGSGGSRAAG